MARRTAAFAGGTWCQHYTYDAAGNRKMDQSYLYGPSAWEVATFNTATNRIADANWHYDDTGNITKPPIGGQTIGYDAGNRQVSFCAQSETPCPNQWVAGRTLYIYDGLGQRVARKDIYGNQTVFVYDAFGNLAAEYAPTGAPVDRTQYVTVDNLGSTRLITGVNGTERHDYYPFGFEALGSWRTTGLGYGTNNGIRQQYTGAEYDSESSLNFLQARYLSTPQGRFASVDPGNAGAALGDPQSWNGYTYVGNNPLTFTDPSGLGFWSDLGGFLLNVGLNILPGGLNNFFGGVIGGAISSANSGPWNEQLPIGGLSGGPLDTGTVFGSGNTGGMVFSYEGPVHRCISNSRTMAQLWPVWIHSRH
jgi:RHS repeat-associated protein